MDPLPQLAAWLQDDTGRRSVTMAAYCDAGVWRYIVRLTSELQCHVQSSDEDPAGAALRALEVWGRAKAVVVIEDLRALGRNMPRRGAEKLRIPGAHVSSE